MSKRKRKQTDNRKRKQKDKNNEILLKTVQKVPNGGAFCIEKEKYLKLIKLGSAEFLFHVSDSMPCQELDFQFSEKLVVNYNGITDTSYDGFLDKTYDSVLSKNLIVGTLFHVPHNEKLIVFNNEDWKNNLKDDINYEMKVEIERLLNGFNFSRKAK